MELLRNKKNIKISGNLLLIPAKTSFFLNKYNIVATAEESYYVI